VPFGRGSAGPRSFNRKWRVTVDTIQTTELDIKFSIEKTLKDEPNKCELTIYNLWEDHRAQLEELNPPTKGVSGLAKGKIKKASRKTATSGIPVKIEAGYEDDDDLSLLWLGDLRTCESTKEGADWVTKLESGDGEKVWQDARVNVSFGPKTPVDTVFRAMVKQFGLGKSNFDEFVLASPPQLLAGGSIIARGAVFSGPLFMQLRDWCHSCGMEFSIQDGVVEFRNRGDADKQPAFLCNTSTGMIGAPSVDIDGLLHVKMLMPHDIRPGRLLVVQSHENKQASGNYKIEKIKYEADTAGDDWNVNLEAVRF
jgi:hypothetical protein